MDDSQPTAANNADDGIQQEDMYTLNYSKILTINVSESFSEKYEKKSILQITECKSLEEALIFFKSVNFRLIPNVFAFIFELKNDNSEEKKINYFIKMVREILPDDRPYIIELIFKNSYIVLKAGRNEKFYYLNLNLTTEELIEKVKNSSFITNNFFNILKLQNRSLIDADLSQIYNFLDLPEVDHKLFEYSSNDELCFRLLTLFNEKFIEKIEAKILSSAIRSPNYQIFLAFFNVFKESDISDEEIVKILQHKFVDERNKDEEGMNVFLFAIKCCNFKVFNLLSKLTEALQEFKDFLNFDMWKSAWNLAVKNECFNVCEKLKTFNFDMSEDNKETMNELIVNITTTLEDVLKFHKNIKAENLEEIKDFIENNPNLKLCYGLNDVCALEHSIDCRKYEIYAFLRSQGFFCIKGEELNKKIQRLSKDDKATIRDENLKHVVNNPEGNIGIILSNCVFDSQSPIESTDVREMLLKFKEIDEINSMFPTVAHSAIKTVFDYKNEMINSVDPTGDEFTLGQAYSNKGLLYVGRNSNLNQRYGTFAHELTHMVYKLIYENKCLPYCKDDTDRENEWIQIVENLKIYCKNNPGTTDNIVKWVFDCYEEGYEQRAEAAVRVNDMLAFHHNNPAEIQALILQHPELFSYYREKVLPDFKITNLYRMIKLNNDFGLIEEINESQLQVKPTENRNILNLATDDGNKILLVTNVPQLMLSKIFQEIKSLPGNKLNLKAKNFFVNQEMLVETQIKDEFKELIQTEGIERIIVDANQFKEAYLDIFNEGKFKKIIVASIESNLAVDFEKYSYKKHEFIFQWQDLTEKSQEFLLNKEINFQGTNKKLSEVLSEAQTLITPGILSILCSKREVKVNGEIFEQKKENLIPRTVMKEEINFSVEDFIKETQKTGALANVVVISDIAGSGKTVLLKNIRENLKKNHLTYFLRFYDYADELLSNVCATFSDFIVKILKLNELEKTIFTQKYAKGEVTFLFSAFDEISRECRHKVLILFNLFETNGTNQLFITTRTHLESELQEKLKFPIFSLKVLTRDEQIDYFVKSWQNPDLYSEDFIKKRAEMLVDKILNEILPNNNVIGLPLIIEGLAMLYKDKIGYDNFEEIIKNLNILIIFQKIVKTFFENLCFKFQKIPMKNQENFVSPIQAHLYHSISHFKDEKYANSLGLYDVKEEWPLEDLAKFGLIKYEKREIKAHFNHETNAEYFAALFMFILIKNNKNFSDVQLTFLFETLKDPKFKVVRLFMNLMLEEVDAVKDLGIFTSSENFCKKVKKEDLEVVVSENLFCVFELIVLVVKDKNVALFKEIIEAKNANNESNLMRILPKAMKASKLVSFLSELVSFYEGPRFHKEFLIVPGKDGETILHKFVKNCSKKEVFEAFWNKIDSSITDKAQLKDFLLLKDSNGENALLLSTNYEKAFYFLLEGVFLKLFGQILGFIKDLNNEGDNFLHKLVKLESVEMLEFSLNKLSREEFEEVLKMKNKLMQNVLHLAAGNNQNMTECLVGFIGIKIEKKELLKDLMFDADNSKNLPIHQAIITKNLVNFKLLFAYSMDNFSREDIKKMAGIIGDHKNLIGLISENWSEEIFDIIFKLWEFKEYKGNLLENSIEIFIKDEKNEESVVDDKQQ